MVFEFLASLTSAVTYLGLPGTAYSENISLIIVCVMSPIVAPFILILFYPLYHRLQVTTSYEYIEKRFGPSARYGVAGLFILARLGWLGTVVLAAGLGGLALGRVIQRRGVALIESAAAPATLPLRLLETAEALAARGDRQQAVFVAVAAAESVTPNGAPATSELTDLREVGRAAAGQDEHHAEEALRLAHQLVAEAYLVSD